MVCIRRNQQFLRILMQFFFSGVGRTDISIEVNQKATKVRKMSNSETIIVNISWNIMLK